VKLFLTSFFVIPTQVGHSHRAPSSLFSWTSFCFYGDKSPLSRGQAPAFTGVNPRFCGDMLSQEEVSLRGEKTAGEPRCHWGWAKGGRNWWLGRWTHI